VNVVGELQQKRTFAASRGFLAAARLSCSVFVFAFVFVLCLSGEINILINTVILRYLHVFLPCGIFATPDIYN